MTSTAPDRDRSALGRPTDCLPTPCLLVDLDRLDANVTEMATEVRDAGAALRPHTKTHKTLEIARMQLAAGATGLTVAKLGEAELLAPLVEAHGAPGGILVAHELVHAHQARRYAALSRRLTMRTCVDSLVGARVLDDVATDAGLTFDVLLDVDTGLERTGVPLEQAVELGVAIDRMPGLHVKGVFSYAGYRPRVPVYSERRRWAMQEAEAAVHVAAELRGRGVAAPEVSVAGSASAMLAAAVPGVTEVRPGTYVFWDMNYARLGIAPENRFALRINTTVVSRPAPDRAVLDAGSKTFAADRAVSGAADGFGVIVGRETCRLGRQWEEHTVVDVPPEHRDLAIGDRVDVIPNHVCPVVNLSDRLYGVRDGVVDAVMDIVGRGRVA